MPPPPAPAALSRPGPSPHHNCGVLGGAGDDVVVVGTPVDVQHGRRVPRHQRVVLVHPSCLQCRGAESPAAGVGALPGAPQAPAWPPDDISRDTQRALVVVAPPSKGETEACSGNRAHLARGPVGTQRGVCPGRSCFVSPLVTRGGREGVLSPSAGVGRADPHPTGTVPGHRVFLGNLGWGKSSWGFPRYLGCP